MDTSISNPFSASSSADPKTAVMNQIRQEAAVSNARQLIEVRASSAPPTPSTILSLFQGESPSPRSIPLRLVLTPGTETQRQLLRKMRPDAGPLAQPERGIVLHNVHGEVHGRVEYGVQAVCGQDTEGEWRGGGDWGPGELFVMELLEWRGPCEEKCVYDMSIGDSSIAWRECDIADTSGGYL